jgi:hypothetical protein
MATPSTTDTLDLLRAEYAKAVGAYSVTFTDTTVTSQKLENLRREIEAWEARLHAEHAASAGRSVRAPIYFDGGVR